MSFILILMNKKNFSSRLDFPPLVWLFSYKSLALVNIIFFLKNSNFINFILHLVSSHETISPFHD